jgi:beta-glucosidase
VSTSAGLGPANIAMEERRASLNVAPPTWMRSVTKNRLLAAGYHGAPMVGMEVLEPETMRALMPALMVHDLHEPPPGDGSHPDELIAAGAVHGGYWRRPYNRRTTLVYTAVLGVPQAYPPLRSAEPSVSAQEMQRADAFAAPHTSAAVRRRRERPPRRLGPRRGRSCAWAVLLVLVLACSAAGPAWAAGRCGDHPWCDTSLSADRRAALLVRALTPEERIGLLGGDTNTITGAAGTHTGSESGVPRLGVPPLYLTDGPIGVRQGQATAFPASIALAASFDRRLAAAHGRAVADEARAKGNDVVYAPTVNILRTPLWGRAFESFGEDPYLTAQTGVAWIRAAQRARVIANVKHFAANNQEGQRRADGSVAGNRVSVDARVDERTLREIYLPHFEAAVKEGRVGSVMCGYNLVNGAHACENRTLLTRILRRDWGFKGFVLADYGASKHVGTGLRAGLDFEPWPYADFDGGEILTPPVVSAALAAGRASQADVDRAVTHLLRTLFAFGFFDRAAYADDESRIDRAAHLRTGRAIAEAGAVLLRNRDGALPLDARRLRSLAVIGADADRYVNGGGSSDIEPYTFTTPRAAITARAGPGVGVRFDDGMDPARAAGVARDADAAVVVVADAASEGIDKPCLGLDCGAQGTLRRDRLIEQVAAANRRTIVVLETAGPVLTPWRDRVGAILEAWYPGSAAGEAIARVLFGDVDPGGRLPATFPRRERELPTAGDPRRYAGVNDVVRYSEGVLVGYRWFDERGLRPAYPFGHGLSYTRFALRNLEVRAARRGIGATVSVTVVNRGDRDGTAVPQLYVGLPGAPGRSQPPRQLKGFQSVDVRRGRTRRVTFRLNGRAFSYWNAARDRWQVAPGCYGISVGQSSRDIDQRGALPVRGGRCAAR